MKGDEQVNKNTLVNDRYSWTFATMFLNNTHLTSAKDLILPNNTLLNEVTS